MSDLFRLNALAQAGRLNRREFIVGAVASGVTIAMASTMFSQIARAEPKKGGHFKIAMGSGSTTDSIDPATYIDTYLQVVGHAIHGYMTEVTNDGKLVGVLAESWEPSPDATVWTFKLKPGVTFHNGKTVEAEDVVNSINHHRGADSKSAAKGIVDPIKDIKADGKDTVVFTLSGGNADFAYILSDYHLPIMPTKDGKTDASGVGCGAYVLEGIEYGVTARAKKNPNFFRSDRGWFDSAEFLSVKDVAARTNALTTGEIHAMDRCDLKTVHLLERNQELEVVSVAGTQHYTVPMLVDTNPLSNVDVRLALKYAVDRQKLLDTILRGYGQLGNDHPISPANRYYAKDLEQRAYDPEKAKFHLKKAGMENLKIDLSTADAAFSGAVDTAVLYKEHAAAAGIDINVIREPNDGYWDNVWMKKPWCFCYWSGRPTEDAMFSTTYAKGASWNDTHWDNAEFNTLLIEARAELDEAKRAQMYYRMQELVRDDGGTVMPMFANYVNGISKKVGHDQIGNSSDLDGLACTERWWFNEA
ncbi:peptide/nickel transport system substrate-binding protein [Rhodoligotrophos appendicifer]|uniref:ABC transporter substrate-binding protein n=1 Tax=Rhodoligotrophos appendicifer TaxID=987056 RepID=UPI0011863C20|nr:ABC transporter substrate-binding protein [Rhodoligotrophos appendicifer]